ncbi:MAG: TIGR02206 family membrane protein [Verrucomicrobia bacterium]|nr:MAG: TIGR02206 family membrane protein [Verrucomicrobiota bacterium]
MNDAPEFQPYGLPHLTVILLTIVLPFVLAGIVRRTKSQPMWTGSQRWFEVAYFWGIGGTLQAVLTPNLRFGFPDWRFISFFTSHCGIIVGVVFLMLTRGYRPYPISIVRVWLWSEFYFVVTFVVDGLTGFNYGFLLHKPEAFSILSFLSDSRPLYLLQMHGVALLFFLVLYAPFAIFDFARRKLRWNTAKRGPTL